METTAQKLTNSLNSKTLVDKLNSNVSKVRKYSLTRQDYISRFKEIQHVALATKQGVVAYLYTSNKGHPSLMAFAGKANKPVIHSAYYTTEQRDKALSDFDKRLADRQESDVKRKAQQIVPSTLEKGDILYTSWGYDQTNVEFFQVVKTIGKRTVHLVRISCESTSNSDYTDALMPVKDAFITKGYRAEENGIYRVKNGDTISFNSYKNGWKWDSTPQYQTALGYGH